MKFNINFLHKTTKEIMRQFIFDKFYIKTSYQLYFKKMFIYNLLCLLIEYVVEK